MDTKTLFVKKPTHRLYTVSTKEITTLPTNAYVCSVKVGQEYRPNILGPQGGNFQIPASGNRSYDSASRSKLWVALSQITDNGASQYPGTILVAIQPKRRLVKCSKVHSLPKYAETDCITIGNDNFPILGGKNGDFVILANGKKKMIDQFSGYEKVCKKQLCHLDFAQFSSRKGSILTVWY